jgi:hypothetical protein
LPDSAGLRRHAAKCRFLADFTVSRHDKQVLYDTAAQFEAQADLSDGEQSSGALPRSRTSD